MTKTLPNWKKRQRLLFGSQKEQAGPERLAALARQAWEEHAYADSLAYAQKGHVSDILQKLAQWAQTEGDYFILQALEARDFEVAASQWLTLAENAQKQGKLRFAYSAFAKAGRDDLAEQLGQQLGYGQHTQSTDAQPSH